MREIFTFDYRDDWTEWSRLEKFIEGLREKYDGKNKVKFILVEVELKEVK